MRLRDIPSLCLSFFVAVFLTALPVSAAHALMCTHTDSSKRLHLRSEFRPSSEYKALNGQSPFYDIELDADWNWRNRSDDDDSWGVAKWNTILNDHDVASTHNANAWSDCVYSTAAEIYMELWRQELPREYLDFWVDNQQKVFLACSSDERPQELTKPSSVFPARAAKDFHYQQAALSFYKGDFAQAEKEFRAVYADAGHPHRLRASYMIARSLYEQVRLYDAYKWALAERARQEKVTDRKIFDQFLFFAGWRGCADNDFEQCVTMNVAHLEHLESIILGASLDKEERDLYVDAIKQIQFFIWARRPEELRGDGQNAGTGSPRRAAYFAARSKSDFLDFYELAYLDNPYEVNWTTLEPQQERQDVFEYSYARWKKTQSDAWLYLAAMWVPPEAPQAEEMHKAIDGLMSRVGCTNSAALGINNRLSSKQLLIRIVRESKSGALSDETLSKIVEATELATELRFESGANIAELVVQFLVHNLKIEDMKRLVDLFERENISNPEVFIAGLHFEPTAVAALKKISGLENARLRESYQIEEVARALINVMPIEELIAALETGQVPQSVKEQAARLAFARSYIVGDFALLKRAGLVLSDVHPSLKIESMEFLAGSESAGDAAVSAFVLENPRLNTYADQYNADLKYDRLKGIATFAHNSKNWWCSLDRRVLNDDFKAALYGILVYAPKINPADADADAFYQRVASHK